MSFNQNQNQNQNQKPYFPLSGSEVVELTLETVLKQLKQRLRQQLLEDSRLSSPIHAFPDAELSFEYKFNLLMSPKGEGRRVIVENQFQISNITPIPPDAIRVLHDLPIPSEETPKNSPSPGAVDVSKMADEIDPQLKPLTQKKFGGLDPFEAALAKESLDGPPAPIADNPKASSMEGVIDLDQPIQKLGKGNKLKG